MDVRETVCKAPLRRGFLCVQKRDQLSPSRVFERFKWSSGPLITSSSSVRNKASEACCRCTSRHTRPTFSGTRGSVSGFHSSSLLPSLPRAHRTTAVPQWDYSLIRLVLKMQRQKTPYAKKLNVGRGVITPRRFGNICQSAGVRALSEQPALRRLNNGSRVTNIPAAWR
jgi:hypothetical protein